MTTDRDCCWMANRDMKTGAVHTPLGPIEFNFEWLVDHFVSGSSVQCVVVVKYTGQFHILVPVKGITACFDDLDAAVAYMVLT